MRVSDRYNGATTPAAKRVPATWKRTLFGQGQFRNRCAPAAWVVLCIFGCLNRRASVAQTKVPAISQHQTNLKPPAVSRSALGPSVVPGGSLVEPEFLIPAGPWRHRRRSQPSLLRQQVVVIHLWFDIRDRSPLIRPQRGERAIRASSSAIWRLVSLKSFC
jgi:hypothetical protein